MAVAAGSETTAVQIRGVARGGGGGDVDRLPRSTTCAETRGRHTDNVTRYFSFLLQLQLHLFSKIPFTLTLFFGAFEFFFSFFLFFFDFFFSIRLRLIVSP